ncbi:MAG: glutaredoxin family protein [Burkholderiales bacterium]
MILQVFFAVAAGAAVLAAGSAQAQSSAPPLPYEIARAQKDFPVTIYTSPNCKELCEKMRAALNQRSVPFTEEQVWNEETQENLKKVSGSNQVPVIVVGRTMLTGFDPAQIEDLLSSAGYPAAGTYPPRNQAAPPPPQAADAAKAEAQKPAPGPKPGPYDTSGLVGPAPKPGPYDPSGLQGPAPKPGPYGVPETK